MSDDQGNNDRAAELFTLLRASTEKMLGLSAPTPVQQLKIDLVASLRMEIDRIVSQQLAGHPADVRALTGLTESLRSLFPVAADPGVDFSGAKAELAALLDRRAAAHERRESRLLEEIAEREELAAVVAAAAPAPVLVAPPPQQPAPPPQPSNVIRLKDPELERLASRTIEPRPAEERVKNERLWRDHYEGNRVLIAPAWSPPGDRR
jgi:hypothetical protein